MVQRWSKDRVVTAISSEGADHFRMAAFYRRSAANASGLVAFVDLAKELGKYSVSEDRTEQRSCWEVERERVYDYGDGSSVDGF
jgi:hypothetical protein